LPRKAWYETSRKRPKRRVIAAPRFYFVDVGVVNRLARRGDLLPGSELYGKALENWIFHELTAYVSYRDVDDVLHRRTLPAQRTTTLRPLRSVLFSQPLGQHDLQQ